MIGLHVHLYGTNWLYWYRSTLVNVRYNINYRIDALHYLQWCAVGKIFVETTAFQGSGGVWNTPQGRGGGLPLEIFKYKFAFGDDFKDSFTEIYSYFLYSNSWLQ